MALFLLGALWLAAPSCTGMGNALLNTECLNALIEVKGERYVLHIPTNCRIECKSWMKRPVITIHRKTNLRFWFPCTQI